MANPLDTGSSAGDRSAVDYFKSLTAAQRLANAQASYQKQVAAGTKSNILYYPVATKKPAAKPTGSGSGSGSGGSAKVATAKIKGLEMFTSVPFTEEGNLRAAAEAQAKAALSEKYRQNQVARGVATQDYQNAITELQRVREQNTGASIKSGTLDRGRLMNMAANNGMGYGQGAGTNLSQLLQKYADIRAGIDQTYQTDSGQQTYNWTRTLNDITEADRVLANNQAAEIDTIYRQMYGDAWDRYVSSQSMALQAMNQRNDVRVLQQRG
jgi:hypothetical protein